VAQNAPDAGIAFEGPTLASMTSHQSVAVQTNSRVQDKDYIKRSLKDLIRLLGQQVLDEEESKFERQNYWPQQAWHLAAKVAKSFQKT
jgi:hypothetical protein